MNGKIKLMGIQENLCHNNGSIGNQTPRNSNESLQKDSCHCIMWLAFKGTWHCVLNWDFYLIDNLVIIFI